jgi:hypothetical protein
MVGGEGGAAEMGRNDQVRTAEKPPVNRCRLPAERKPCIIRSRFRSGTCEFSALLFRPLWDRCSTRGITCRPAAS